MPRQITPATSLDTLRKEAKRWLRQLRAQDQDARRRLESACTAAPPVPVLRDVQHALAREYGLENWLALRAAVKDSNADATAALLTADEYQRLADDLVAAFDARDQAALDRLNAHYGRTFSHDDLWAEVWRRVYAFRQRAFKAAQTSLRREEAQLLIAQDVGYGNWAALTSAADARTPRVPAFAIHSTESRISPQRRMTDAEWDALIATMKARRITSLDAGGLMTDDVLARVATLDHVTALNLGGSRELSDDGLRLLARMPQLERLDLSEYPGGKLTDRGLEVLRHLPNLRRFEMTWQRGITDAGAANLRFCDRLEKVNLMGSPTGDGVIAALQGKPALRHFSTGRLVTDDGLRLLKEFPRFQTRQDREPSSGDEATHLLIDGPFTNQGLASLAGLEGVNELDLFWHVTGITSAGFAHLVGLPNLLVLGADGALSDDEAMRHIGAMPRLRRLRAQGTVATDDGFEALSRSRTLEGFWTRDCESLGDRGFLALSTMPALRSLGVSCKNVSDAALAALPRFPSLRELTPIGMTDRGFAHVGRCDQLERLTCMYCRETTDAATEQIAGLRVKYYYAGLTLITDRSLEILGRMTSLEEVEFYECQHVTDAGLVFLAGLPNLRAVALGSLPGVTLQGTKVFPPRVRVDYST